MTTATPTTNGRDDRERLRAGPGSVPTSHATALRTGLLAAGLVCWAVATVHAADEVPPWSALEVGEGAGWFALETRTRLGGEGIEAVTAIAVCPEVPQIFLARQPGDNGGAILVGRFLGLPPRKAVVSLTWGLAPLPGQSTPAAKAPPRTITFTVEPRNLKPRQGLSEMWREAAADHFDKLARVPGPHAELCRRLQDGLLRDGGPFRGRAGWERSLWSDRTTEVLADAFLFGFADARPEVLDLLRPVWRDLDVAGRDGLNGAKVHRPETLRPAPPRSERWDPARPPADSDPARVVPADRMMLRFGSRTAAARFADATRKLWMTWGPVVGARTEPPAWPELLVGAFVLDLQGLPFNAVGDPTLVLGDLHGADVTLLVPVLDKAAFRRALADVRGEVLPDPQARPGFEVRRHVSSDGRRTLYTTLLADGAFWALGGSAGTLRTLTEAARRPEGTLAYDAAYRRMPPPGVHEGVLFVSTEAVAELTGPRRLIFELRRAACRAGMESVLFEQVRRRFRTGRSGEGIGSLFDDSPLPVCPHGGKFSLTPESVPRCSVHGRMDRPVPVTELPDDLLTEREAGIHRRLAGFPAPWTAASKPVVVRVQTLGPLRIEADLPAGVPELLWQAAGLPGKGPAELSAGVLVPEVRAPLVPVAPPAALPAKDLPAGKGSPPGTSKSADGKALPPSKDGPPAIPSVAPVGLPVSPADLAVVARFRPEPPAESGPRLPPDPARPQPGPSPVKPGPAPAWAVATVMTLENHRGGTGRFAVLLEGYDAPIGWSPEAESLLGSAAGGAAGALPGRWSLTVGPGPHKPPANPARGTSEKPLAVTARIGELPARWEALVRRVAGARPVWAAEDGNVVRFASDASLAAVPDWLTEDVGEPVGTGVTARRLEGDVIAHLRIHGRTQGRTGAGAPAPWMTKAEAGAAWICAGRLAAADVLARAAGFDNLQLRAASDRLPTDWLRCPEGHAFQVPATGGPCVCPQHGTLNTLRYREPAGADLAARTESRVPPQFRSVMVAFRRQADRVRVSLQLSGPEFTASLPERSGIAPPPAVPEAKSRLDLAIRNAALGRDQAAEDELHELLRLHPRSAEAVEARRLLAVRRDEEAEPELEAMLRRAEERSLDVGQVRPEFEAFIEAYDGAPSADRARRELAKLAGRRPADLVRLASSAARRGEHAQALLLLDRMRRRYPLEDLSGETAERMIRTSTERLAAGEWDALRTRIEVECLSDVEAVPLLADFRRRNPGTPQAALAAAEERRLRSEGPRGLLTRARREADADRPDRARILAGKLLRDHPGTPESRTAADLAAEWTGLQVDRLTAALRVEMQAGRLTPGQVRTRLADARESFADPVSTAMLAAEVRRTDRWEAARMLAEAEQFAAEGKPVDAAGAAGRVVFALPQTPSAARAGTLRSEWWRGWAAPKIAAADKAFAEGRAAESLDLLDEVAATADFPEAAGTVTTARTRILGSEAAVQRYRDVLGRAAAPDGGGDDLEGLLAALSRDFPDEPLGRRAGGLLSDLRGGAADKLLAHAKEALRLDRVSEADSALGTLRRRYAASAAGKEADAIARARLAVHVAAIVAKLSDGDVTAAYRRLAEVKRSPAWSADEVAPLDRSVNGLGQILTSHANAGATGAAKIERMLAEYLTAGPQADFADLARKFAAKAGYRLPATR